MMAEGTGVQNVPPERVVLVGIGGTTRSGKSTLATRLHEELPRSKIIHADRYWQVRKPFDKDVQSSNWEVPEAVNYDELMRTIDKEINAIQSSSELANDALTPFYLFVEGFLIYANPTLAARFDKRIFLTISKKTCFQRRQTTKPVPCPYFEKLLWPAFVKYNSVELLQDHCGVSNLLILDAESDPDGIYDVALQFLVHNIDPPSALDTHKRNLANNPDLSKYYLYFDELFEILDDADADSKEDIQAIIERNRPRNIVKPPGTSAKSQHADKSSSGCLIS